MAVYKYTALADDGTKLRAATEAMSAEALRNELLARRLQVVRIREKKSFSKIELTKAKVPPQEIMHFSRQVAAFVRAGIPLVEALQVAKDGAESPRFKEVLTDCAEQIQSGIPFSEALARHREIFPSYYIGILSSAEITGQLDIVLDQLSEYMDRDLEARQKIKSALVYPMIIGIMSVLVVVILVAFVLPRFTVFFKSFGAKLPLPTRMLLAASDFTQTFWYLFVILFGVIVYCIWASKKTVKGKRIKDTMFTKFPMVREIVEYSVIERFCRIIGAMMTAGVPLPDAMAAAIEGTNNVLYRDSLSTARERMLEGEGMAAPIRATERFPEAMVQMVRVGEETGTLDQQLGTAGSYYARELEYKLKKLTSMFEPIMIIFMGVMVGFVAVALVSAMYGIFNQVKT